MPSLFVYSRRGCHLCEELIEELLPLVRGQIKVEIRDVDSREEWRRAYDIRIPVVEIDEKIICEHRLDRAELQRVLNGFAESDDQSG